MGHVWLLATANRARAAGVSREAAYDDLRAAIPRKSPRDVRCAIEKAYTGEFTPGAYPTITRRKKTVSGAFWRDVIDRHPEPEAELWERSPVHLENPDDDTRLALERLYDPDDLLFIGEAKERGIPGANIRRAVDWLEHPGPWPEHIIVNPLTGEQAETKTGGLSYRCDAAVKARRFCVVEFDRHTIQQQAAFWCHAIARGVRVSLILHSGSKSLHAWIPCGYNEALPLFERFVVFGADPATRNPSRMSRTPGAWRASTKKRQGLIYLNPEALS